MPILVICSIQLETVSYVQPSNEVSGNTYKFFL
jgi:hypothetical protein